MGCTTCGGGWKPSTIEEAYAKSSDVSQYGHSGICLHLPYMREVGHGHDIVELGTGGGDQSTVAWIASKPKSLTCYDVNRPGNIDALNALSVSNGVRFEFRQGDILAAEVVPSTLLFVDSLHTKLQVETELARFVCPATQLIVFHDTMAFGDTGQCSTPNQGILLAIGRFLIDNPEWRVDNHRPFDNGLLTLKRA